MESIRQKGDFFQFRVSVFIKKIWKIKPVKVEVT